MGTAARRAAIVAIGAVMLCLIALPDPVRGQTEETFSPAERVGIIEVIRGYLLDHPEFLVEVMQQLDARQREQEVARQREAVVTFRQALLNDPDSVVGGNPEGDVTIVEFFDYHCPYCKQTVPNLADVLAKDPGVRIVYKEYPILGPDSLVASRASLAARNQGHYIPFHAALMALRGRLDKGTIMQVAAEVGLDIERLEEDMKAPEITVAIERAHELAQALGIHGTPSFVIGETVYAGVMDVARLEAAIEEARTNCATC